MGNLQPDFRDLGNWFCPVRMNKSKLQRRGHVENQASLVDRVHSISLEDSNQAGYGLFFTYHDLTLKLTYFSRFFSKTLSYTVIALFSPFDLSIFTRLRKRKKKICSSIYPTVYALTMAKVLMYHNIRGIRSQCFRTPLTPLKQPRSRDPCPG